MAKPLKNFQENKIEKALRFSPFRVNMYENTLKWGKSDKDLEKDFLFVLCSHTTYVPMNSFVRMNSFVSQKTKTLGQNKKCTSQSKLLLSCYLWIWWTDISLLKYILNVNATHLGSNLMLLNALTNVFTYVMSQI